MNTTILPTRILSNRLKTVLCDLEKITNDIEIMKNQVCSAANDDRADQTYL